MQIENKLDAVEYLNKRNAKQDSHYNGWKVLEDHIALYGPKSGYEILMFNIRKYSERSHKKGQLQDDLRKIITYAEKAREVAEKYNIEEIYRS